MSDTCKRCPAQLRWVRMAGTGKAMPLDAEPTVDGNIILDAMGKAYVLDADEYVNPKVARYTSHFATCPSAAEFRKSRSK